MKSILEWAIITSGAALLLVFIVANITGVPRHDLATRVLKSEGYTAIETRPGSLTLCGDDIFRTRFTATSQSGEEVNGAVCSGFFKGASIRIK